MDAIARPDLESSLQATAIAVLNQLVAHNVKGADLLQKGFNQLMDVKDATATWYETLKQFLIILQPMFLAIESWLERTWPSLVAVFAWAKDMWHKIFG